MSDDDKTKTPDLESLASDYMDLWQKQLSAIASDEAVASVMAKTAELINNSAVAVAAMSAGSTPQQPDQSTGATDARAEANNQSSASRDDGSSPLGPAHGNAEHVIQHLSKRVERLEERLAALESNPRPDRK